MKLALRVVSKDGTSYNGFQWPLDASGNIKVGATVTAPDWDPVPHCGGGLHGWLHGRGDHGVANIAPDSIWLAVEPHGDVIELGGKVKFASCTVRFVGSKHEAAQFVLDNSDGASASHVIGLALSRGNAAVADLGTATAGDCGTATAGYGGTATAGNGGTATAGYGGTATAGDCGTATAGKRGTATAGNYGTATAGNGGIIQIRYWDGARYRIVTGYVGEDGIEANVAHHVVDGLLVKKEEQQ